MTPHTLKRAAFKEKCCTYSRTIMSGKLLDIKNIRTLHEEVYLLPVSKIIIFHIIFINLKTINVFYCFFHLYEFSTLLSSQMAIIYEFKLLF